MKLFVLLLVIVLFILWKKNKARSHTFKDGLFTKNPLERGSSQRSKKTQADAPSAGLDELIACAICGLHTPKSQMVLGAQQRYQCAKHP